MDGYYQVGNYHDDKQKKAGIGVYSVGKCQYTYIKLKTAIFVLLHFSKSVVLYPGESHKETAAV